MKLLPNIMPVTLAALGLSACSALPPLDTVAHVDLPRFMGDWYVIASIPTFLERDAHNAVETYALDANGNVATTFTFRDGGFDGREKTYRPTGLVATENNAVWGMQFIWPIEADYRIIYLDDTYSTTVIGRRKRDFVWIMARAPTMPSSAFDELVTFVGSVGYDTAKIRKVPQQW